MAIYIDGRIKGHRPIPTFERLDEITDILGSTKQTFWPFIEGVGGSGFDALINYRGTSNRYLTPRNAAAAQQLSPGYSPVKHVGGVQSYELQSGGNQFLDTADSTELSFGNGTTTDAAFSLGLWILPQDITTNTLMAKWDVEAASEDREWKLGLDGSSNIEFSLYDDNANASEIGASDTVLTVRKWSFVVVTYDGAQADPGVTFYLNGAADGTGTTESGSYVAMQAGSEKVTLGAHLDTNAPAGEFSGRLALPFITGTELTANNVASLHAIGQELLGLA